MERLLTGAAAALPTAKLEHVKAVSSHSYDVRLYVQNTCMMIDKLSTDDNIFSLPLSVFTSLQGHLSFWQMHSHP